MSKNLKIQIITILSLVTIVIASIRTYQTFQKDRAEGSFEALLIVLLATSNVLLIRTLMKQNGDSK